MAPSSVAEETVVEQQPAAEALLEVGETRLLSRWMEMLLAQRSLVSRLRVHSMPRRSLGMVVILSPLYGRSQSRTYTHGTLSSVPAVRIAQRSFLLHTGTVSVSKWGRPRRLRQIPRRPERRRPPQYSPASIHSALRMQRPSPATTVLPSHQGITSLRPSSTSGTLS